MKTRKNTHTFSADMRFFRMNVRAQETKFVWMSPRAEILPFVPVPGTRETQKRPRNKVEKINIHLTQNNEMKKVEG